MDRQHCRTVDWVKQTYDTRATETGIISYVLPPQLHMMTQRGLEDEIDDDEQ